MFQFVDIPPNETVVQTYKARSHSAMYGPGLSQTSLTVDITTDVQKTREDVLVDTKQYLENGKIFTKSKQIVTRVFTVRQEISRGLYKSVNCFY